ncbi:hypothetical protein ACFRIC_07195 [Streptomyces sp. NPDC056738]|uniref:hypothetical protein n=1 Tax=Streptomyces sp. NPDC056738 TaxID=3345933 RepID=UPI00368E5FF2
MGGDDDQDQVRGFCRTSWQSSSRLPLRPGKPLRARLQGYGEPGLFVTLVTGVAMAAFLAAGLFTNLFA